MALAWRLCARDRTCRDLRCREKAVAELNRKLRRRGKVHDMWWAYCAAHMYGRWIEDGKIMSWRVRETGDA